MREPSEDREFLTIFDSTGRRIGVKTRAEVHRDGDWHWLVFVWVAWTASDGRRCFLLQLRARPGDPYRGQLDAPAGGHVWAKESHLTGALRECQEEMGVRFTPRELVYLGQRSLENPAGVCRRVMEHWRPPPAYHMGLIHGTALMQIEIARNGSVLRTELVSEDVDHSSLTSAARLALEGALPYRRLPGDFPDETLILQIQFFYPNLKPSPAERRRADGPGGRR